MTNAQWLRAPWLRRVVISIVLLVAVALWVDPQTIIAHVQRLSPGWVLLALLISVFQVMLSAWRWQLTARLIQVPMRFSYALSEYYLALLVNQLLPGGVLGDAGRAHRHAAQSASTGRAWRAVIIERVSGQVALALLTLVALALSPLWHAALGWSVWFSIGVGTSLVLALVAVGVASRQKGWLTLPGWCLNVGQDIQRGLLTTGVWPVQLVSSLTIVLSYGAVMVCAARSIGVELPVLSLLALAPVVLLAMLIPFSVAGWGVREGAAAGVWAWVGLPAGQGVAVSLAYGVVVLLATLPGLWVALGRRHAALPPESGRAQQDVEKGVVTAAESSQGRAQRTVQRLDGRHLQAGAARANQQRSDQQVQSVYYPRLNKLRDGNAAAFYQDSVQLVRFQQRKDIAGCKLAPTIQRQHAAFDRAARRGQRSLWPDQMQRGRFVTLKQLPVHRHPAAGIQHHPRRMAAANVADGQLRVIGIGGSGPYHHRIGQRSQPMQMHQACLAIDVMGMAALGGNPAIQALPQLRHHPSLCTHQRRHVAHQFLGIGGHRICRFKRVACQQVPPGIVLGHFPVGAHVIRSFLGVGHDASALSQPLHHAVHDDPAQAPLAPHTGKPGGFYVSH
ncbi:conserved hypothetical protein [Vreelandella arcis]|uniref:Lysylphosphatidylglycerol synthase TM region n=1 Tax=Vreelandella arcis TaxID=416873 RepID=A0A1H0HCD2_9GAMM|nr:conserved hypothetical protein [Halomonas arcis]